MLTGNFTGNFTKSRLRFSVRDFERGRELGRETFVLLMISSRLVSIQFLNRVARNLCVSRQIMRGQDCTHVAGFVAGDRIDFDLGRPNWNERDNDEPIARSSNAFVAPN